MSEVWAIDPGKRNGFAKWNWETGVYLGTTILSFEDVLDRLAQADNLHSIVIESFRSRGAITRGSSNEASQVIGAADSACRRLAIPLVRQQPGNRFLAAKWAGIVLDPRKHTKDDISAYLHGFFYMHQQGKVLSVLEKKMGFDLNA